MLLHERVDVVYGILGGKQLPLCVSNAEEVLHYPVQVAYDVIVVHLIINQPAILLAVETVLVTEGS